MLLNNVRNITSEVDLSEYPAGTRFVLEQGIARAAIVEVPACRVSIGIGGVRHFVGLPRSVYVVAARHYGRGENEYWLPSHFVNRAFIDRALPSSPDEALAEQAYAIRVIGHTHKDIWLACKICGTANGDTMVREDFATVCRDMIEGVGAAHFQYDSGGKLLPKAMKAAKQPDWLEQSVRIIQSSPDCESFSVRELLRFDEHAVWRPRKPFTFQFA